MLEAVTTALGTVIDWVGTVVSAVVTGGESPGALNALLPLLSAVEARHIDIRMFILTRFYSFTLSHYGSQAPLSTLKPSFTASAPRLSTGCLLDFTGTGLSPACICSAELAHCLWIPDQRSPPNDGLRLVN